MWKPVCPIWRKDQFTCQFNGAEVKSKFPNQKSHGWSSLMPIDTEALAEKYRAATVNVESKKLLITDFRNTEQEHDLTEAPNCGGFGRIRHFLRATSQGW